MRDFAQKNAGKCMYACDVVDCHFTKTLLCMPLPTSVRFYCCTGVVRACEQRQGEVAGASYAFCRILPLVFLVADKFYSCSERLKDSQNTAAMLTTYNEIDMTSIIEARNLYKDEFMKKKGVKLGFMSMFVGAACKALQEQPIVNAVIDGDDIVYRDYVDVSVAVSSPTGLVVPVLRDVQNLDFAGIEQTIAAYGEKAAAGQLAIEDMAGGTFTVSNGGVFGSMMSTPIINQPQAAICETQSILLCK
jgi:hypothetical protein